MIDILRHNKHAISTLIAVVVFFNAIASLSIVVKQVSNSGETSVESLFGDKILICTPTGFQYISFDELQKRQNNEQQYHCAHCQINASVNILFAIDLSDLFAIAFRNSANQFYVATQSQKIKTIYSAARPRAPPFFL
ncbi:MAG: hypothetical protein JKY84_07240 [Emcibacteraceae bacterium]|nr:hypothetical protein [Emcibacteraceae bacterium]